MITSIIAIVLAVVAIVYGVRVALVFQRFNDGIKDWAEKLDDSTNAAINRAARNILRELDEKISAQKEETDNNDNVELLNLNENDESC